MSNRFQTSLFSQVDRTKDPDFFVRFMDEAQKPAGIQASKRLMLERMALAPGEAVLEVGCGPGTDVFDMVALVGPAGRLVGLDASEVMIAEARRRAKALPVPITFEVGQVQALPFPDGTFDVCRAGRLLEHLPDAERALADLEARGGRSVVARAIVRRLAGELAGGGADVAVAAGLLEIGDPKAVATLPRGRSRPLVQGRLSRADPCAAAGWRSAGGARAQAGRTASTRGWTP